MKFLMMAFLALSLVSCSSSKFKEKFNDVKLEVAKEGKEFVTKELKSEYASVEVEGANCESEAEKIGLKVEEKLISFLKAEQKEAALMNKSLSYTVLPTVCSFVVDKVVPELLEEVKTEYVCLRQVGSDKLVKIGKDLCEQIK